ncbi:MAG: hypothetical protein AABY93_16930 [Bacteroidota bacterium]
MTIKYRFREKGINAALILLLYLMTGIYSLTQAQSFTPSYKDEIIGVKDADDNEFFQHHALWKLCHPLKAGDVPM